LAVILALAGSNPLLLEQVETHVARLASDSGLRWETLETLSPETITDDIAMVIALPPLPDLDALVMAAPQVQFLAIGFVGLEPGPNLSLIGPSGTRPDRQGFLAGYLAAIITPDWRVGVISAGDTIAGRAARQGFLNGVRFFCGLCQPVFPPFENYPLFVEIPSVPSQDSWKIAADTLVAKSVQTVYIHGSVQSKALFDYLSQANVNIIGSKPSGDPLTRTWIASVSIDLGEVIETHWPNLLTGQGGETDDWSLIIGHVNKELVSPGRLRLANAMIDDLQAGIVDTGVDPITGELR
jgi:hypothetical protein